MYEAFYGLHEKPFNLTPDPRFLYLSIKHKEAFAHLFYGIRNRGGFVMVSGEIGTGKTTICRSLLKQLDAGTEVAFIFNPKLSPEELLRTINADFGIPSQADTVRGLIDELNAYLLKSSAEDKNCVLVIDEAQNLSTDTLEQIRLLSNLETETEKLLQIVLIGQPELADQLALPELRQLNQRITARYHLGTLDKKETLEYIAFRLSVAGGRQRVRFTRGAVRRVFQISDGTPRVINALCDRALLIGYTKEAREITSRMVRQAAKEVQGDRRTREIKLNFGRVLPASAFVLTTVIAVLALVLITSGPLPTFDQIPFLARFRSDEIPISESPTPDAALDSALQDSELENLRATALASQSTTKDGQSATESTAASLAPTRSNVAEAASLPVEEKSTPVRAEPEIEKVAKRVDEVPARLKENLIETPENTTNVALTSMLRSWNLAMLSDVPVASTERDMRRIALQNGLSYVPLSISIEQIAIINLPVLVRLNIDFREQWAAVIGIEGNNTRVLLGPDGSDMVLMHAFRDMYTGDAVYLWADPAPGMEILRARSSGPAIRDLQIALKELGLLSGAATGEYNASTIETIMRIQRAAGLPVDGITGPQTRMVIASWQANNTTPSLTTPSFTEEARSTVLAMRAAGESPYSESSLEPLEGSALPARVDTSSNTVEPEGQGEESARVTAESLELTEYRPQLEIRPSGVDNGVTRAAGPIVPIVPSDDRGGARR